MLIRAFFVVTGIAMAGTVFATNATAAPYKNCSAAKADGVCKIPSDSP
ncbi:hypothetical protein SAMN02799620_04491 [Mycolicibacterium fluoranthenivorans]|jgi:hypothetical protein|uniref:Uncharacterized protein n=1 Tax=Mycolicibacterium fluoranthenivorans TaxID=258505 RepID=A0A1G4WSV1_9MYCO|nr:hypothetical protein SAMN02799620_04491 [Mycolicibacterium fluoranthenivorans]